MKIPILLILGTCFQALQVVAINLYPSDIQVNTIVVAELVSVYKCFMYKESQVPDQNILDWSDWNTLREYMASPIWFFGFAKKGSGIATVGAFVSSRLALQVTKKNKPSQIGENVWWYYNNVSYGFAPNSTINQNEVDIFNPTDPRRLSIGSNRNGYRLGATSVGERSQYYSLFFLCDPSRTPPPSRTPSPTFAPTPTAAPTPAPRPAPSPAPTAATVPPTKRCGKEPTICPTRKPTKHRCRPTRSPKPSRK